MPRKKQQAGKPICRDLLKCFHTDEAMEIDKVEGEVEEGLEIDDDQGFMSHALRFPKDNTEETEKAQRDYEVIDPRQRGARAKEEERERKRAEKKGGGGRYRR